MPHQSQVLSSDVTQGNFPWLLSSPGDEKREMIMKKKLGLVDISFRSANHSEKARHEKTDAVISLAQNLTGNKNVKGFKSV